MMKYNVDAAWQMYRLRVRIIGQIRDNETVFRTSLVEKWKPQLEAARSITIKLLQGHS